MTFGKLPKGITGEQVISTLNLEDGEQILYACRARGFLVSEGAEAVFAFTNLAIYWLDGRTLAITRKQVKGDILNINYSLGLFRLNFVFEDWALSDLDKSDRKALQTICEQAYPKLSASELNKAKKDG